ncbi:hypothetical protein [Lysobacter sp. CA199]|uniref:hypothetical protein n=1 Tax=Lysobacter sp. CA199 TaxID=3455608 RepID=UPI003F8D006C
MKTIDSSVTTELSLASIAKFRCPCAEKSSHHCDSVANRRFPRAALVFVLLAVSGCSNGSGGKMPTYKQNPAPKDQYELTVVVSNAPGPFASMKASMQYDITNMDCLPPAEVFSGVQKTPISTFLPIRLEKVDDSTYRGEVALDGLVDGDYFGHGVCRFSPVGPSFQFKASGAEEETRFVASLDAGDVANTAEQTTYYWKGGYPRDEKIANYPDHGSPSPEKFVESLRDQLFSITIKTARTAQP